MWLVLRWIRATICLFGTGNRRCISQPGRMAISFSVGKPSDLSPGDANADGKVDLTDFGILKANFGSGTTAAQGDFNGDAKVDLTDFGILKDNFGKSGAGRRARAEHLVAGGAGARGSFSGCVVAGA